jgi:hypothetical protein
LFNDRRALRSALTGAQRQKMKSVAREEIFDAESLGWRDGGRQFS